MGSTASKETRTTSSCFGDKEEREVGRSGPPAHRGPNAIASVARLNPHMSRVDLEKAELADKGPVHGIFVAQACAEAAPHRPQMTLIQHSDPLYPGKQRSDSYFCEGKFLQNHQVRDALGETLPCGGGAAGSTGSQQGYPNIQQVCSGLAAPRFPVIWLKHVTTVEKFLSIVNEGAIRGCDRTFILKGSPVSLSVSCWSPHIPRSDLESFKNTRLEDFMQRYSGTSTRSRQLSPVELDVRETLANSPALRDDSRYGNCQFPFGFEELLRNYKEQHCGGQEPALRVLGTEAYKLEVVHWVLIHSPSWREFDHLPWVDSVWPRSQKGNLLWVPESTTDLYTWFIDPSTGRLGKYPLNRESQQTYDPSRWNNVVFALYLHGGRTLNLGRGPLLGRVEACETAGSLRGNSSRVLRHPPEKYVSKEEAENIIYRERLKASLASS